MDRKTMRKGLFSADKIVPLTILIVMSLMGLLSMTVLAADRQILPQVPAERPPLVVPKTPAAAPQTAPKTILPPASKTISVGKPLTAEGAREPASNTVVPMKTLTVPTPLEATGPR
jgi:hypothetical protein